MCEFFLEAVNPAPFIAPEMRSKCHTKEKKQMIWVFFTTALWNGLI
jgi:hypothetical protein